MELQELHEEEYCLSAQHRIWSCLHALQAAKEGVLLGTEVEAAWRPYSCIYPRNAATAKVSHRVIREVRQHDQDRSQDAVRNSFGDPGSCASAMEEDGTGRETGSSCIKEFQEPIEKSRKSFKHCFNEQVSIRQDVPRHFRCISEAGKEIKWR